MSGGPPHHPRQNPSANAAWNHLQVPNYFPTRQPQHAHMSNEHPLLHQPTWHTPTTEPMKPIPPSHLYNLEQMLNERHYPRHSPGVDLSLTRNGSQSNGDMSTSAPISLSVRDANKINSLSVSAIDMQSVEMGKGLSPGLKSLSPGLKSISPGLKSISPGLKSISPGLKSISPGLKSVSPGLKSISPGLKSASPALKPMSPGISTSPGLLDKSHGSPKNTKRSNIRVDSFLERLNPQERLMTSPASLLSIHEKLLHFDKSDKLPVGLEKLPITVEKVPVDKYLPSGLEKIPIPFDKIPVLHDKIPYDKTASDLLQEKVSGLLQEKLGMNMYSMLDKPATSHNINERQYYGHETDKNPLSFEGSKLDSMLYNFEKSIAEHRLGTSTERALSQPSGSHDENSNSSSVANIPVREDDMSSAHSNEDSLDSGLKSRRKRKPSKTIRVAKDDKVDGEVSKEGTLEAIPENAQLQTTPKEKLVDTLQVQSNKCDIGAPMETMQNRASEGSITGEGSGQAKDFEDRLPTNENLGEILEGNKIPERRRSSSEPLEGIIPLKTRRKTSSESETIANIAAMVQESFTKKDDLASSKSEANAQAASLPSENIEKQEETKTRKDEKTSNISINQPSLSTTIQTAAQRKATNFVEVENKLEEMFAGIDESLSEPIENNITGDDFISESINDSELFKDSLPSGSSSKDVSSASTPKKTGKKTPGKKAKAKNELEGTPKKKKAGKKSKKAPIKPAKTPPVQKKGNSKKLNGKPSKLDAIKDIYAYDSGSNTSSSRSRGPFIQIKGPRDSPISVNIVNTPLNDEDPDKKPTKTKKFHDDTEYRHKVRSKGLHCSTLSNKYDAQTKDISWICSFCKLGPHCPSVVISGFPQGDLFGPYIIGTECSGYEKCLEDPYDAQFKSKKAARAADAIMATKPASNKKSKRKRSESEKSEADAFLGITETLDKTYEVWVHEDCIVWSPGVYLVGPKIVGLEDAVWTACNVKCALCSYKGANVCCLRRGCVNVAHISCARAGSWQLDQANYKAYCPEHRTV